MTVDLLEAAAAALGDLRDKVVFLGGATVGVWVTDPAAREPRVTYDVDVVAEVTTLGAYAQFREELRRRGFAEDIESGIAVRYRHRESGLILDVVPLEVRLAGLGGRWLRPAAQAAVARILPSGTELRLVPPAWLVVTKLEAFADRGNDDCLASRDFEDVVLLVDGREELAVELDALPDAARAYVRAEWLVPSCHRDRRAADRVLVEQTTAVVTDRLGDSAGRLSARELSDLDDALALVFGL